MVPGPDGYQRFCCKYRKEQYFFFSYDSDMLINYTAELCQTAVYCFLADVVTSEVRRAFEKTSVRREFQAQAVAESAYNSNWYRESPKVQKSVAFVLARSQRTTTFKAAGLINVNISTFSAARITFL